MSIAIDVREIVKRFGDFTAVDGISFAVEDGETFGLLGPNGAGKSTLIRMLTTLLLPTSGTAIVASQDIVKDADRVRRAIGVIPQALTSDLDLTAEENLLIFAKLYGVPRERRKTLIADLLAAVELSQWADKPVKNLSGGMRRRVEIARGLVHEPRILFLDEPTAGVDPKLREAFWQHFRDLAERGATLVVSTHLMDEAHFCDRLAIMRDGAVLACDTPRNLLRRGRTLVSVWRGEQVERRLVADYPRQLPALLRSQGLDPAIDRIEIEEDTLDTVVLDLIDEQSAVGSQPSAAGRDRGVARAAAPTDRVPLEE